MANCYIDFRCIQQDLERTDENVIAEGVAKRLYARFDLCPKWDGLKAYARFKHMNAVYDVPIIDSCAEVPAEVVKYTGFEVSVFGEDGEGGRLTSALVFNEVKRGIDVEGVAPMPATPSMIDTLISKAAAAEAEAAALRADADAGAFAGAPFYVSHVFGSIADMEAFEGAEVGEFAVINCGAEFEENARVYQREAEGWLYIADMSGLPGKDGDAVYLGASQTVESDGNGTFTFGMRNNLDPQGVSLPLPVDQGGTGATDAATARRNLGVAPADHTHDYDGVYAPKSHVHTPEDIPAMVDYIEDQGYQSIIMADQYGGSINWTKFKNGLAIVTIEYKQAPIASGIDIETAGGGAWYSESAQEPLPFRVNGNVFGSIPGYLYTVEARIVNKTSVSFRYHAHAVVSDAATENLKPVLTVIGRWHDGFVNIE